MALGKATGVDPAVGVGGSTSTPLTATLLAVGPWQEPSVDIVVRDHAVNDSALHQFEAMQMRYRVTRSVEAIYRKVSKGIRLKPLYKSTVCGTVCCTTSTLVSSSYQKGN